MNRLRIVKAGFATIEGTGSAGLPLRFRLDPAGAVPEGMVRVSGGRDPIRFGSVGKLPDFWIDRFEVSNRQFKRFVDAGGYRERSHWREPFVEHGHALTWEAAMDRLRDSTGRPGPATWAGGTTVNTGTLQLGVGGSNGLLPGVLGSPSSVVGWPLYG